MRNGICSFVPCEKFNIFRRNGRLFSFLNVAGERLGAEWRMWAFGVAGSQSEAGPERCAVSCSTMAQGAFWKIFLREGAFPENSTGEYFIFSQ